MSDEYASIKKKNAIGGYEVNVSGDGTDRSYDAPGCEDMESLAKNGFIGVFRLQRELEERSKRRKRDAMKALGNLYKTAEAATGDERILAQLCEDYVAVYEEIKG